MRPFLAILAVSFPSLIACVTAPHGAAKAQEAALDLNVNARFGRMEIAAERVAPKGREDFFDHRKSWGGKVRIGDCELAGLRLTTDDDADVTVRVAWYRNDEQELRVTTLRQKWHDFKGEWKLVSEQRTDGDIGLIGERVVVDENAPRQRKNAQFPTVRIGSAGEAQAEADVPGGER